MPDELLPYYEKELAYIRQLGAEFAREHPKIAARLGIAADTIEDPHVSRLIEGFAYLNARLQHKLDDDLPELSDALLGVLFPHYQRPIPSMSIVQFVADRDKLDSAYLLPRETLLDTEQFDGESCRFTTIHDVTLHPFEVAEASLIGRPFTTPGSSQFKGAAAVLKISLQTFSDEVRFSDESPQRLRFYLKGQPQHVNPLYELLLNRCQALFLCAGEADPNPVRLPLSTIQPVGFGSDEGLLPYPESSFLGYRLLSEYFAFPAKFMFFDLQGIADKIDTTIGNRLEFYLYLSASDVELEHNISAETFQLGCVPAVNLFKHRADPIKLDHRHSEYEIVPDARRPEGLEVYSIDRVQATTTAGDSETYLPLYGINHETQGDDDRVFWFSMRRHARLGGRTRDEGTDVFLSLVDLNFNPNIPEDRSLTLDIVCSNRDQPARLPFSDEQPRLQCVDGSPPCTRIRCLTKPGPAVRPPLRNHARWRLISHLSLNHLSITGRGDATTALKEILRLYDFKDSSVNRAQIESIVRVGANPICAPMTIDGHTSLCRGIEIEIELDESQMSGNSSFLFASVLEHFFALYSSINSFTRVLVKLKDKEGYLKKCPPRAGEKILL